MKTELIGVGVILLGGLTAAVVKYANWRLARARREDLQFELREAFERKAAAKNDDARAAEDIIIADIERRMKQLGISADT